MQFRVDITESVKPGQMIRVSCPDGTQADVKVPKGVKTGESFDFEIPVDELNNPQPLLDQLQEASTAAGNLKRKGIFDRNITNVEDLTLAICAGLMIGLSIVIGFLAGVLYATRHVEVANQANAATSESAPINQMPQLNTR